MEPKTILVDHIYIYRVGSYKTDCHITLWTGKYKISVHCKSSIDLKLQSLEKLVLKKFNLKILWTKEMVITDEIGNGF
jgi:hypothetical protein